jgi:hypothetical protein
MHIAALFIGAVMSVLTFLTIRERILMKKYNVPHTTAAVLYDVSMPLGLVGAALSGVWLVLGFSSTSLNAIVIVVLLVLAAFTALMALTMVATCNAGTNLRAERSAAQAETTARAGH